MIVDVHLAELSSIGVMVRTSERQKLLRQTLDLIVEALIDEELTSLITGELPDTFVSDGLIDYYVILSKTRYIVERETKVRPPNQFFDRLKSHAKYDRKLFRGLVRMKPRAFYNLIDKMRQTKAFGSGKHTEAWIGQRLGVALYRLGRSGNGSGINNTSKQCDCSVGSVVNYTKMTLAGFEELMPEILTFATEDERAAASAKVKQRNGVEECVRGWLAVGGPLTKLLRRE